MKHYVPTKAVRFAVGLIIVVAAFWLISLGNIAISNLTS